jgi:hypothetical protein
MGIALFASAFLGIFQEVTYRDYGREWKEGLFYTVSALGSDLPSLFAFDYTLGI